MKKRVILQKLFRITGIAIGLIAVLIITALSSVSLWLPGIASPIISRHLGTDVQVDAVQLRLHRGYAAVQRLMVAQPEGFTDAPNLLTIENTNIKVRLLPLLRLQVIISNIHTDNVTLHIVRNADGVLNIEKLINSIPVKEKPPRDPKPPPETLPSVTLTSFNLPQALITYTDFSVSPPVILALTNMQIHAHALRFDPEEARTSTSMPGRIRIEGHILQPGFEHGYIGVKSALGIISTNIPPVNAAACIIGFDIRSVRGLLPPGISTAIGGSNLDVIIDASLHDDYLYVYNRLQTSGNTFRLSISGTPYNPYIDRSTALFNLLTRPGAFITGTVGGVADASVIAGRTVVSTAGRAGTGVFRGITNIGRGAARTATSAVRGDIRGIGDGVVDMTYGTVTGAVDTVTGTARSMGEGFGDTLSAATGRSQTRNWESTNRARWEQRWEEALNFATSAPFPGAAPITGFEPDPADEATEEPSPPATEVPQYNDS